MLNNKTFEFLKWLEDFNDKKFFELYKPLYLKIKVDFYNFVDTLIKEISKFDESIAWLKTQDCIFRIYKDMRFERNRSDPYKTNLWAYIAIEWKRSGYAWYYIHIENNKSFFSWWIYRPSKEQTNNIRGKIYKNRYEFNKIINNRQVKQYFWNIVSYQESLKKTPKGFESHHPSNNYIKYKDWLLTKEISNKEVLSKNFIKNILKYVKIAKKLTIFLNN